MTERQSGILMHISSLPGNNGIGSFGSSAYAFVDFLVRTKQRYWQILPLGPTSYGDSPYQSFSAFAGNTHFIDFDLLIEDGYLNASDIQKVDFGHDPQKVNYAKIFYNRRPILETAVKNFKKNIPIDFHTFISENKEWLDTFAQYMAIKEHFNLKPWTEWEDEAIVTRQSKALKDYTNLLKKEIEYHRITQYLFFKQWFSLKHYANKHGIEIIGDMPIYIAADSADMWANPHFFKTDENGRPSVVAGCPPDGFSAVGQLWGNPIYDWDAMKSDGFKWWIKRLKESFKMYDMVRIDHFIGFASYWEIPASEPTAVNGRRMDAPGFELFEAIHKELGDLNIIAEDLGSVTDKVIALRDKMNFPGMKILQFAFDPHYDSIEIPHNYQKRVVAYTGTHDNNTITGWYKNELSPESRDYFHRYTCRNNDETVHHAMFRTLFSSVAFLTILTMQDLLMLDEQARMNLPNTLGNNWVWRMTQEQLTPLVENELLDLTQTYKRENVRLKEKEKKNND